ncbi:MAG: DUF1841 family protein [Burkholderiales bacterium]|nr:DUF1841 family protein [Burkholderiales bacterium]
MFNPNQTDVRNFFFDTFEKNTTHANLTDLEKIALSVILEHPEYENYLSNREKYTNYQWCPESGENNPFLHMSLHVNVIEQLLINQPHGIVESYQKLCLKFGDKHNASHELMDCIIEIVWQAQCNNTPPDVNIYFTCINKKLLTT